MNIQQLLTLATQTDNLQSISAKTNASPSAVEQVVKLAGPLLVGALANNTQTDQGKQALHKAIKTKHTISSTTDLSTLLQSVDMQDGTKILGHIFGSQQDQVTKQVAKKTGVDSSQATNILAILAPMILGNLGSKVESQTQTPDDLASTIQQEASGLNLNSLAASLLDQNHDGSVVDDLANIAIKKLLGN